MAALLPQDDDAPAELAGDSDAAAVSDVAVELLEEISEHPGIRESLLGNAEHRSHGGGSGDLPSEASALLPPLSSLLGALALSFEAAPAGSSDMAEIAQQKELRKEVAELVETLVDMAGQFRGGSAAGRLHEAARLQPMLRAAYGGTLASDDVSLLRAIRTLDGLPTAAEAGDRALWGLASNRANQRGGEAAGGGGEGVGGGDDVQHRMLLSCLQSAPPDPRRCALTVLYFPENRGPGGLDDDDDDDSHEAVDAREAERRAAAYDPAALVGLAVATLRSGICGPADLRLLAQVGMVSVCVRALSSNVESMRTLALEAVKLYQAALDPASFRESSDISQFLSELLQLLSPPRGPGQKPAPSKNVKSDDSSSSSSDSDSSDDSSSSSDSSEDDSSDSDSSDSDSDSSSSDASGSLSSAAQGASQGATPGRVPAHVTVLCAEAVVVLLSPKHSMHRTIQKALGRGSMLDTTDLPLFNRLMFSTSKDTRSDLDWILRFLSISITSDAEAQVFRRRFVAELVTAYAGSATASAATTTLCLHVVSSIASVPSSARDFALHSGGLQWLSMFVTSHLDGASSQSLPWALIAVRTMAKVFTGLCASGPVHPAAAIDLFSAVRSVLSALIRATPSLRPEDAPMPPELLSIWKEALGLMAALSHKEGERLTGSGSSSGPSNSYVTAAELAKVTEAAEAEPELCSSALRLLLTWHPELSVDSAQKPELVLKLALWASQVRSGGLHEGSDDDLLPRAAPSGTIKASSALQWLSRLSASGWLTPAALPSESSLALAQSVLEAQLGLPWAQRVQCLKPTLCVVVRAIQRAAATGDGFSTGSDCSTWHDTATEILPQLLKRVSFPLAADSDVVSSGGEAFAAEMALAAAARLVLLPPVAADKDEIKLRTRAPAGEAGLKAVRKELVAAVKAAASDE